MTSIVRKFLMAASSYFVLSLIWQAVTLFDVWLGFNPLTYSVANAMQRLMLLGWLSQGLLALIYRCWLSQPRHGQQVFVLFNLGLPLAIIGQPALALLGFNWLGGLVAVGGMLQLAAGGLFALDMAGLLRGDWEG